MRTLSPDQVTYSHAADMVVGYVTATGRISRLFQRDSKWRFENIANTSQYTMTDYYVCSSYDKHEKAIKKLVPKSGLGDRHMYLFPDDAAFYGWVNAILCGFEPDDAASKYKGTPIKWPEPITEARRLAKLGYVGVSSNHKILARIDRKDWISYMVARHSSDACMGYEWVVSLGEEGAADQYRRTYSRDKLEVSADIYAAIKDCQRVNRFVSEAGCPEEHDEADC